MSLLKLPKKAVPLDHDGAFPEAKHVFEKKMIDALNAAMASRRALLVRGEPGTGKSQLARAAAELFQPKRAFVSLTVDARTESRDLLYTFDAIARLADAQAQTHPDLDTSYYLAPGPLWWAIDPDSADKQVTRCRTGASILPYQPKGWQADHGMVLLIDEIDKADAAVPNGLLETLGQQRFPLPSGGPVEHDRRSPAPLVIVTTNEDRALPDPFLRRCLVLHLALPKDEQELTNLLIERGGAHFPGIVRPVLEQAAAQLMIDRRAMIRRELSPPGCAEYIDLLRAIDRMAANDPEQQTTLITDLARYVYKKHPED